MKAMFRTSVLVMALAITGLLAFSAAPALAAPEYYGGDQMQFDPELIAQMAEVIAEYEGPEEYPVPPEEIPLDPCLFIDCEEPGDEGEVPGEEPVPGDHPDEGDNPGIDGGGEPGQPEEQLTPDTPEQPVQPPDTPQQNDTPKAPVSSSKLPNTGSGLLLIAAAGVLLIAVALGGSRLVRKRTR